MQQIDRLSRQVKDWDYVVQIARRNGVIPLLYKTLNASDAPFIPADVLNCLQGAFEGNTYRNFLLTGKLLRILKLFKQHNILAVPFKGPALAEMVYGDLALRSFVDLDILIHPKNAARAIHLMIQQGYQPSVKLNVDQLKAYIKKEYSVEMFRKNATEIIELHWELTGRYLPCPFTLGDFERRLKQESLAGKNVCQFPSEELLLYLCIHGAKDAWNRLEAILSVAELIRTSPGLDWIHVQTLSQKMKCKRILLVGLYLASHLFDANLPEPITKKIEADPIIKKMAKMIYHHLFHKQLLPSPIPINSDFSAFHFKIRDSLLDKIRYGLSLIFKPSRQEWRYFPLPASLSFLHYLLRPARLIWGFGCNLCRK